MKRFKLCMLGAFAVGKTSLVSRFVHSIFSDQYLTTVGVKIDKKTLDQDGGKTLILWDLSGEDDFQHLQTAYLRGASAYLLVADGTRAETLDVAVDLQRQVADAVGPLPFTLLLNKADLADAWELDPIRLDELRDAGWHIARTSARTGEGVEQTFADLGRLLD